MTHFVSVIEDKKYLLWQQELQALNLQDLGQGSNLTVVVLHSGNLTVDLSNLERICTVKAYPNLQTDQSYLPSNKPYGLMKLLEDHPELGQDLFLLDSDVIFREIPDFSEMTDTKGLYMSDCTSYLGLEYIRQHYSESSLMHLCDVVGIPFSGLERIAQTSGGAQYYFKHITAEYCRSVMEMSCVIYKEMCRARDNDENKIQVWTAEMWAWLWAGLDLYNFYVPDELAFCWATDPKKRWDETKILHLAGVMSQDQGLFYKGKYMDTAPWEGHTFDYVTNTDSCSWVYLKFIQKHKGIKLPAAIENQERKRRAVVGFLQNKPELVKDFWNLYKSFKKSKLDQNTDLIIFTDDMSLELPDDVMKYYHKSQSESGVFKDYHFINSISCIAHNSSLISRYEYVLKTDLDTFLTPQFLDFFPYVFHTGVGQYTHRNVAEKITDFAKRKGIKHKGIHDVGATWYGAGHLVAQVAEDTLRFSRILFEEETFGDWPGWYRGVVSMYASELAVNHNVGEFIVSPMIDTPSSHLIPVQDTYHIHCLQVRELFSKYDFYEGKYNQETFPDMSTVPGYCLGVALE